jgi:hypothetical protein
VFKYDFFSFQARESMASEVPLCNICNHRHLSINATVWCPECQETLCLNCNEHHSLAKLSRDHNAITISDYQKQPSFLTDIMLFCADHHQRYQLYCVTHECPICYRCIKTHRECGDVIPIDEVVDNAKTSQSFQDLRQEVEDLVENIKRLRTDREENLTTVNDQVQKHILKVQNLRSNINQHLDKLEEELKSELKKLENKAKTDIQGTIAILNDKENDIVKSQKNIEDIMQHASDFQAFLGMREVKSNVTEHERFIQSLPDDQNFTQINITCSIDTKIQDILTGVKFLGSVEFQTERSSVSLVRNKDKQAQILTFNEKSLKLKRKVKIACTSKIRGCCLTTKGLMLFTSHYNLYLMIVFGDDSIIKVPVSGSFDVVCIDDNTAAVTTGDGLSAPGINIVNIAKRSFTKFVPLLGRSYGITYYNDSLICCVENKNLHVLSCSEDFRISTIPNTATPTYSYVVAFAEKVIYTDKTRKTIKCCLFNGTPIWQFKDEYIVRTPRGIAVDEKGYLYLIGECTSNTVIISADGQYQKQILTNENGLNKPSAVCFDKPNKQLLVANVDDGMAYIFSFS